MLQIFNPTALPIVPTLKLIGSHGERIEFFVRNETSYYEVLSVNGTVYEMTPARRERKPLRFEALDPTGKVIDSDAVPKGA